MTIEQLSTENHTVDLINVTAALEQAFNFGKDEIDLSECYYGESHWSELFIDKPHDYYYFLAGIVAKLKCRRILELGTHFGGSIFSMAKGLEHVKQSQVEIVTVDIRDNNTEAFENNKIVTRFLGNCLSPGIIQKIGHSFSGAIDLLYIDSHHYYNHTRKCVDVYLKLVSPRYIIIDDIYLNDSMRQLWNELKNEHGDNAIDITGYSRREENVGFGLLVCN